jgi:hypothetical protein
MALHLIFERINMAKTLKQCQILANARQTCERQSPNNVDLYRILS